MRLFVAIELPPAVRNRVAELQRWLAEHAAVRGKWVEVQNLHLTPVFLGEVAETKLERLSEALLEVAHQARPFLLKFEEVMGVPTRQPRLLAIRVQVPPIAAELQQELVRCTRKLGLKPSAQPLHLTLVRLKEQLAKPIGATSPDVPSFSVASLSLVQSTLTAKGPVYKPLKALKLASRGPNQAFRPSVAACVLNPKNEVLLVWHREHHSSAWQFPQGGIEPGDTLEQTLRRELKEELGIINFKLLVLRERIYRYRWPARLIQEGSDASKKPFVGAELSLGIVRVPEIRPRLKPDPREAAKTRWVPLGKFLSTLSPVRRGLGALAMVELDRLGIGAQVSASKAKI